MKVGKIALASATALGFFALGFNASAATIDFGAPEFSEGERLDGVTKTIAGVDITFRLGDTNGRPLVVFDTEDPTGGNPSGNDDGDLGTPNGVCVAGGPGVGSGGEANNCEARGNALIIHEDKLSDGVTSVANPDDYAGGGYFFIDFSSPVEIDSVGILDIENSRSWLEVRQDGSSTYGDRKNFANLGDNSFQDVIVDVPDVISLKVNFDSSAAMPYIAFTTFDGGGNEDPPGSVPTPAALPLLLIGAAAAYKARRKG